MSDMIIKPRISEKAYGLSQVRNTFVFDVPYTANKISVKLAVQSQYGVTVTDVNISIAKGKEKRFVSNGKAMFGNRSDVKKAYVTLKAGDSLPIFAAITEEAEKTEKAAAKAAKKETK